MMTSETGEPTSETEAPMAVEPGTETPKLGPQWKPDRRRKVHRDAKKAGLYVCYDGLDIPAEPKGQRKAREEWIAKMYVENRKD